MLPDKKPGKRRALKKEKLTLVEYIDVVLPIIKTCVLKNDSKPFRRSHLWYLYRQVFYGFSDTSDFSPRYSCSKKALAVYKDELKGRDKMGKGLHEMVWHEQHEVDPDRERLILEHMYTGTTFRDDMVALQSEGRLDKPSIADVVR